jgi:hypothetical protein
MPPQAEESLEEPQTGGATKLVSSIHSQLSELADMLGSSQAVDDDDKQQLAAVIQQFQRFVDGLGAPKSQNPAPGAAPMEAGATNAKPMM